MVANINIVSNDKIISIIKTSKYFKVNLGLSYTMESANSADDRVLNTGDSFAYSYNHTYKTVIYAKGNIGNIRFYTDHYIKDNKIAMYYNLEDFIFNFDFEYVREKGIDSYLGSLIKKVETDYEEKIKKEKEQKEIIAKKAGDPNMVFKNPGGVTWADLVAYKQSKRNKI